MPGPEQAGLLFKTSIEPDLWLSHASLLCGCRRFEHGRRAQPATHDTKWTSVITSHARFYKWM